MCNNCQCKKIKSIEVEIGNGLKLVCLNNTEPFEKDFNIFVEDENGAIVQDLASIGLDFKIDDDCKIHYLDNIFSVKVFADSENEGFTVEHLIPNIGIENKKFSVSEVLRLEKIEIEENTHGVLEYGKINIDSFEGDVDNNTNFKLSEFYDLPNVNANYDGAYTDYTVYKNGEVLLECVPDTEVNEYINDLLRKYK